MKKTFVITDEVGIHARPATLIVNESSKFSSESKMIRDGHEANLKSIMGVMALGCAKDDVIEIEVVGDDEQQAMESIAKAIIENNIGIEKNE